MSDLRQRLARLGLSQYCDVFTAEGFDTWETVLDITESDLSLLSVKLGHRRKLQRAIAEYRGQSSDRPLPSVPGRSASVEGSFRSDDDSGAESKGRPSIPAGTGAGGPATATKRKYRRHPKPDEYAPERPPSAYVIFSNQVRESLRGQDYSFTEIAKVVGERWQVLPADDREACEKQANTAKEKYYAELADYKKTAQYAAYQKYLVDFKAKHAMPTKEGKRSRPENETRNSNRSSSHDRHERAATRRLSAVQVDLSSTGHQRAESSPPMGPTRLPTAPSFSSKPTSPASHSMSAINSPRTGDHYSPVSASPRSSMFDIASSSLPRDARGVSDAGFLYRPPSYPTNPLQSASSTSPSQSSSYYANTGDAPSRRTLREHARLPPLTHDETTWSSESGHSGSGYNIHSAGFPSSLPPLESGKPLRTLPQPVPSLGPMQSPLDRISLPPPLPTQIPPTQLPDYRTQGPLAVLIRAGELAAEDEVMHEAISP